ncbi:MAG: peptide chain release factor N(5)-glutamine methyltransferase [Fimbriimonadales bacterium]|nr:peptide chain release factor N(5)-glutamine methyltransferase [Fimbriimonadales bacterium]
MTVREALAWARAQLEQAGLSDAQREAEILVAMCLSWDRAQLIACPDAPLAVPQRRRYECWVRRRARREPLPYITRRAWFYGLEFTVGRGVLIPRPETEVLVELFLRWAGGTGRSAGIPMLVDAGVGSGAIAIACLQNAPHWLGVGIDRSRRALHIAQINRRKFGLQTRLLLTQGDWLNMVRPGTVDAVLSNPPYVLPDEWDALEPEITRYEPRAALLVPADDPLQPYRRIAQGARRALKPSGLLAFETSPRLAPLLAEYLPRWGFPHPQIQRDYSGAERVVYATKP